MPLFAWRHTILHATTLIRIRPITNHECSYLQLTSGSQPNISHLCIFCCVVYVPITLPQRSKLVPQRRLGIYVGFNFPSIIHYLEPITCDVLLPTLQIVILMKMCSRH